MTRVYDDVAAHRDDLPGDLPRKAGGTHIGIFFAWCVGRGLASSVHAQEHPAAFENLRARRCTGRDYLIEWRGGRLAEEDLDARGRAFAEDYVVPGTYLEDYETTLRGARASRYHVPDRWEAVETMAPVLDARYEAWRAQGEGPAAHCEGPAAQRERPAAAVPAVHEAPTDPGPEVPEAPAAVAAVPAPAHEPPSGPPPAPAPEPGSDPQPAPGSPPPSPPQAQAPAAHASVREAGFEVVSDEPPSAEQDEDRPAAEAVPSGPARPRSRPLRARWRRRSRRTSTSETSTDDKVKGGLWAAAIFLFLAIYGCAT